ncbi:MAG: KH domain-containing protein [Angelakisella sp.]|nr:KH domain-containing protein [Angelakisella sp.]
MIQETIATGRDVNAAIDNGCRELGISREEDSFDFEIIAREKKGFLGLKTYPAKVRVFRELPDPVLPKEEPPKAAPAPAPRREQPAAQAPAAAKPQAPRQEKPARDQAVPASAPAGEPQEKAQQAQPAAAQPPRREPHPPRERKPREQRPTRPQEQRPPHEERAAAAPAPAPAKRAQVEVEPTDNVRARVERSAAYVERILGLMGIGEVKVTPRYYEDNVCLQLTGSGLGVIIGRRGETLDSIQYLSSLVANRGEGDYIRINIDSGNYREKRERTLEALARKLANTAVRTGKSTTLEPMNPYERRVIHGAVSQIKGATSSSIGVDPNRRVVISAIDGPKRSGDSRGRRDGGRERDRDRDRSGERRREGGRGGRRDDRRSGPRPPRPAEAGGVKAPRPKLDDGPAPERVYAPKAAEPAAPPPKTVEFTQEEREATQKTSLYGKIEL